jgi:hypothetical protein
VSSPGDHDVTDVIITDGADHLVIRRTTPNEAIKIVEDFEAIRRRRDQIRVAETDMVERGSDSAPAW